MEYSPWSEDIEFPYTCDFCTDGCQCGSSYGLDSYDRNYRGEVGECDFCLNGCNCPAQGNDELECTCECECCTCSCDCEILEIDAESYNSWIKKTCYVCLPECFKKEYLTQSIHLKHCLQPLGEFEFYVRVFPQYHTTFIGGFLGILGKPTKEQAFLRINSEDKENRVCFSGPVYIPIIAKKDKDPEKDEIWMSLTPMEIFTLRPALEIAKGNVLIAGLGMGWLTQRVLELETVSSVTQIELNSEILDFFGKPLINKFPDKIRLINQDIWEFIRQNNVKNFDTILFDIWPKINDSKRDKNFKKLMAAHPNVWGWGYENEV